MVEGLEGMLKPNAAYSLFIHFFFTCFMTAGLTLSWSSDCGGKKSIIYNNKEVKSHELQSHKDTKRSNREPVKESCNNQKRIAALSQHADQ